MYLLQEWLLSSQMLIFFSLLTVLGCGVFLPSQCPLPFCYPWCVCAMHDLVSYVISFLFGVDLSILSLIKP